MITESAVCMRYRITLQAYSLVTVEFSHNFIKLTLTNLQVLQKKSSIYGAGTVICFTLHLTAIGIAVK